MKLRCLSFALLTSFTAGTAFAQQDPFVNGGQQQPVQQQPQQVQPTQQVQPMPQQQPAQQPMTQDAYAPVGEPLPAEPVRPPRHLGVYGSVPIFVTESDVLRPGVGIHGRFGWEFGFLVPEIQLGYQYHGLADGTMVSGDFAQGVQTIWLGLGARLQLLNNSRFVPFVSAALRINFISVIFEEAFSPSTDFTPLPGVQFGGGLMIELTETLAIEAGLTGNLLFDTPADPVYQDTQFYLQPNIGITLFR